MICRQPPLCSLLFLICSITVYSCAIFSKKNSTSSPAEATLIYTGKQNLKDGKNTIQIKYSPASKKDLTNDFFHLFVTRTNNTSMDTVFSDKRKAKEITAFSIDTSFTSVIDVDSNGNEEFRFMYVVTYHNYPAQINHITLTEKDHLLIGSQKHFDQDSTSFFTTGSDENYRKYPMSVWNYSQKEVDGFIRLNGSQEPF